MSKTLFGADVFELDVHLTADNHPVAIHDYTVNRTTDGRGVVRNLTLSELKKLDAGYRFSPDSGATYPWRNRRIRIPTLAEVLDTFPNDRFNIEIKPAVPGIERRILHIINQREMEGRVLLMSPYREVLEKIRRLDPLIPTASSFSEKSLLALLARPNPAPMNVADVPYRLGPVRILGKKLVRLCQNIGIHVHVWTVNDTYSIQRLLRMGVDGIITDRPDVAWDVFVKMGVRNVERDIAWTRRNRHKNSSLDIPDPVPIV